MSDDMYDDLYDGLPMEESVLASDDVACIAKILKDDWSLSPRDTPVIRFIPETEAAFAMPSEIYVYQVSRYNSISSTDYRTLQRNSFIGIRISTRSRDVLYRHMDEVYRILMANRRAGLQYLNHYTYMEAINDHIDNGSLGWYTATIDVKLISYCFRVKSPGFGRKVNESFLKTNEDDQP